VSEGARRGTLSAYTPRGAARLQAWTAVTQAGQIP